MAYTQEQINAALATELAANPNLPQSFFVDAGKSLGLSEAQINAAFDTIAGFNAQGQYDAADYIANRVAGTVDPQMVVDAANAARAKEQIANEKFLRENQIQHSVLDEATGKRVQLNQYHPDFDPNNPITLAALGQKVLSGDTGASNFFLSNPQYRPLADAAWAKEKARLNEIDRVNALNESKGLLNNNAGANKYAAGAVVNADGSVKVGDKLYSASDAALYNAYLGGNVAEVNRLLAANKLTGADVKSKFGLTDADIAWITNNAGGKFYSPDAIKPPIKTDITNVINTIGGVTPTTQTAPVGQFRELFPSFAESKRLAGQMVAGRPNTENIISMINSNAARPVTVDGVNYSAPESAAYNAYISGNIPEFNRLTQLNQLTAPAMQSKFSLSDADMAYITGNRGGVFYNPTETQQIAPTSLNNVLSMISK